MIARGFATIEEKRWWNNYIIRMHLKYDTPLDSLYHELLTQKNVVDTCFWDETEVSIVLRRKRGDSL